MKRYSTAQTLNLEPLPIIGLDYSSGQHISAAPQIATSSGTLDAGAYLITATAPILFRGDGLDASPGAGSIYIAAGMPMHLLIQHETGGVLGDQSDHPEPTVSVYPLSDPADVYIVPLR